MEMESVVGRSMELFDVLSEKEVQSFAVRLDVHPDSLRHIIEPMEGIAGINLREELERWVTGHHREKERTSGMTLEQLVTDTRRATLIPSMTAALRQAQEHLAALDKEEEEARKHAPKGKTAL